MPTIPQTTDEALSRQYRCDCWSLGGCVALLEKMHDLWGVDVTHPVAELRRVRADLDQIYKGVRTK